MNFLPLLGTASLMAFAYFSFKIARFKPRSELTFFALCMNVLFAYWSLISIFNYGHSDPELVGLVYHAGSPCWNLFGSFGVHFVLFVTERRKLLKNKLILAIIYLPGVVSLILNNTLMLGEMTKNRGYWIFELKQEWPFYFFTVYYVGYIILSIILLFHWSKHAPTKQKRGQGLILACAYLVPFVLGFLTDTLGSIINPNLPNLGIVYLTAWGGGLWFAVTRYNFLAPFPATIRDEFFHALSDLILYVDEQGQILWTNQPLPFLDKVNIANLQGKYFLSCIDMYEADRKVITDVLNGTNEKARSRGILGNTKIEISISSITDRGSGYSGFFVSIHDISELEIHKGTERALFDSMAMFDGFLHESMDGIFLTNSLGIITHWNPMLETMLSLSSRETVGRNIWDVLEPVIYNSDEKQRIFKEVKNSDLKKIAEGSVEGFSYPMTVRLENVNGKERYMQVTAFLIHQKNGFATAAIFRDISMQKKLEEENIRHLKELNHIQKMEALGTLTGGLAHDFNNIVGSIVGAVSLIKANMEESDGACLQQFSGDIEIIESSAKRASAIVRQLLALVRKRSENPSVLNICATTQNVINIVKAGFDTTVNFVFQAKEESLLIRADESQIEQVLLNLLINAAHSMTIMRTENEKPGGIVRVCLSKEQHVSSTLTKLENDYVRIDIIDSGVGIPDELIGKIFDPFFSTKEKDQGIGLGLAMVDSIVHQYNGFINIDSKIGVGTVFTVYLPIDNTNTSISQNVVISDPYKNKGLKTILIIDDDENLRSVVSRMLSVLGYTNLQAESGKIALDILRTTNSKIDAVLLDLSLPLMSGDEIYLEIQKLNADIPVIMSSGFHLDERISKSLSLGVKYFLPKPFSLFELSRSLHSVFENEH